MTAKSSDPVYFSKYLAEGKITEAQSASKVSLPHSSVYIDSWAGYVTVNASRGDHLFLWCFPKEQKPKCGESSPLLVWLNGGPGFSSLLGLFEEIGPLVADNNKVSRRAVTWADKFSLLFIDNPVGVGFSYRESSNYDQFMGEDDISDNLYECLKQFVEIFPEVKAQDIYVGGQSYGGKYVPHLAHKLHTERNRNIRMKGIYIGSGLISPHKMLHHSHTLLTTLGVVSQHSGRLWHDSICAVMDKMKIHPKEAMPEFFKTIFDYMDKVKGYPSINNIVAAQEPTWTFEPYVNLPEVQAALHIKPTQFKVMNDDTPIHVAPGFLTDMSPQMATLMDNQYKVLLFNGMFDPVVSVQMTNVFLSELQWSGRDQLAKAEKKLWDDGSGNGAAYVTTVGDFSWTYSDCDGEVCKTYCGSQVRRANSVIIPRAGHRTAIDQPKQVLNMMVQFIDGKPF